MTAGRIFVIAGAVPDDLLNICAKDLRQFHPGNVEVVRILRDMRGATEMRRMEEILDDAGDAPLDLYRALGGEPNASTLAKCQVYARPQIIEAFEPVDIGPTDLYRVTAVMCWYEGFDESWLYWVLPGRLTTYLLQPRADGKGWWVQATTSSDRVYALPREPADSPAG